MKFTEQEIQGPFAVTFEVNRFVLYMMKDYGELLLGRYYDKSALKKDIKDHGLKNVTFHGLAIQKYLNS